MILQSAVRLVSQCLSSLALLTFYKLLILDNQNIDRYINEKMNLAANAAFGPNTTVPHVFPHSLAIIIPVVVAAYCYTYTFRKESLVLFVLSLSSIAILAVHSYANMNRDGDLQYATVVCLLIVANLLRSYYFAFIKGSHKGSSSKSHSTATAADAPLTGRAANGSSASGSGRKEDDFRTEIRKQQEQQEQDAIATRLRKMKK